jgi:integrase
MTTYAAGLRVSEVCQLRIADLLSDRHQIRVVQGKGKKDRYTFWRKESPPRVQTQNPTGIRGLQISICAAGKRPARL